MKTWEELDCPYDPATDAKFPMPDSATLRANVQIYFYGSRDERCQQGNEYGFPIGEWDVKAVMNPITDFSNVFRYVDITDDDLSGWDMSAAVATTGMFYNASGFLGIGLDEWDVSNLVQASNMFAHCPEFDASLAEWNVAKVTEFSYMFHGASTFNGEIEEWDTSSGTNFQGMFKHASSFHRNISKWSLEEAIDTSMMFEGAGMFNYSLSEWKDNIKKVRTMRAMFNEATKFSQDLTSWDVSGLRDASLMFRYTSVEHDYCDWELKNDTNVGRMFFGTPCPTQADPKLGNETNETMCGPFCFDCNCSAPPSKSAASTMNVVPTLTLVVTLLSYLFG